MSARKDDNGKLRFDLIPVKPLQELARVYTIGASKYDDRNWEKGLAWGRVYAAMQRHANAWWAGERCDQVDGQEHLASVAWCALALMEFERTHPEMDDRTKKDPCDCWTCTRLSEETTTISDKDCEYVPCRNDLNEVYIGCQGTW